MLNTYIPIYENHYFSDHFGKIQNRTLFIETCMSKLTKTLLVNILYNTLSDFVLYTDSSKRVAAYTIFKRHRTV